MLSELLTPHWIESEMRRNGYSDASLARTVGVTSKAVEFWRTGHRRVGAGNMEALLGAFGYELEVHRVAGE
ncbi:MAG: hypothetical protein IKG69_08630 [Atopobiaceae bacterium]|nr:hypothetical protein [Atopobiaceae bacterium]